MPFSCYISAHHEYMILKQTFYTSHLGLYNYPMGGQLHLSQGPTIEIFGVPKKTIKSRRDWLKYELTETWSTGSSQKQSNYSRWLNNVWDNNSRQALDKIGKSDYRYNRCDILTLQRIKHWWDPGSSADLFLLAWILFSLAWLWR